MLEYLLKNKITKFFVKKAKKIKKYIGCVYFLYKIFVVNGKKKEQVKKPQFWQDALQQDWMIFRGENRLLKDVCAQLLFEKKTRYNFLVKQWNFSVDIFENMYKNGLGLEKTTLFRFVRKGKYFIKKQYNTSFIEGDFGICQILNKKINENDQIRPIYSMNKAINITNFDLGIFDYITIDNNDFLLLLERGNYKPEVRNYKGDLVTGNDFDFFEEIQKSKIEGPDNVEITKTSQDFVKRLIIEHYEKTIEDLNKNMNEIALIKEGKPIIDVELAINLKLIDINSDIENMKYLLSEHKFLDSFPLNEVVLNLNKIYLKFGIITNNNSLNQSNLFFIEKYENVNIIYRFFINKISEIFIIKVEWLLYIIISIFLVISVFYLINKIWIYLKKKKKW